MSDKMDTMLLKSSTLIIVPDADPRGEDSVWRKRNDFTLRIAAEDAFEGEAFEAHKNFAKKCANRWIMLTTERGLIDPGEEIGYYNVHPDRFPLTHDFEKDIHKLDLDLSTFSRVVILTGSWNKNANHVNCVRLFFQEKMDSENVIELIYHEIKDKLDEECSKVIGRGEYVDSLLEKYETDLIQIDALYQWASNPSFKVVNFSIEENYPFIEDNLKKRYQLGIKKTKEVIIQLRADIERLLEIRGMSYDLQKEIRGEIEEKFGKELQSQVIKKLQNAKADVQLFNHTLSLCYASFKAEWPKNDFQVSERDNVDRLIAQHFAAYGSKPSFDPLVTIGIVNKLFWLKKKSEKSEAVYKVPRYSEPLLKHIEEYIEVPEAPDVEEYIDGLLDKREFEQLRLLENLLENGGVDQRSHLYQNLISAPGVVDKLDNRVAAVSPRTMTRLNRKLIEVKKWKINEIRTRVKQTLESLKEEHFPLFDVSITGDESFWVQYKDNQSLLIYVVPWISSKELKNMRTAFNLLTFVTCQSIPSLQKLIGSELSGVTNITFLCVHKGQIYPLTKGEIEPLMEQIIEQFKTTPKILEEPVSPPITSEPLSDQEESITRQGKLDNVQILRGGDWKIEKKGSVYEFKVKIVNTTTSPLMNINVLLNYYPKDALKLLNEKNQQIQSLLPNSTQSLTFRLLALDRCVGDKLMATVSYLGPPSYDHSESVSLIPWEIEYKCNLLKPKLIDEEEFDSRAARMQRREIKRQISLSREELIPIINEVLRTCNFAIVPDKQADALERIKGFAIGKFDQKGVAINIGFHSLDQGTEILLESQSDDPSKLPHIENELMEFISEKVEELKGFISEKVEDLALLLVDFRQELSYSIKEIGRNLNWSQEEIERISQLVESIDENNKEHQKMLNRILTDMEKIKEIDEIIAALEHIEKTMAKSTIVQIQDEWNAFKKALTKQEKIKKLLKVLAIGAKEGAATFMPTILKLIVPGM